MADLHVNLLQTLCYLEKTSPSESWGWVSLELFNRGELQRGISLFSVVLAAPHPSARGVLKTQTGPAPSLTPSGSWKDDEHLVL